MILLLVSLITLFFGSEGYHHTLLYKGRQPPSLIVSSRENTLFSLKDCMEEAKSILHLNETSIESAVLGAVFFEKEVNFQKDKEIFEKEVNFQKDKEIFEKEVNFKKDKEMQSFHFQSVLDRRDAYHYDQMSYFTQRPILESLFRRIVQKFKESNILQSLLTPDEKKKFRGTITMTQTNAILSTNVPFRVAVWELLGIASEIDLPALSSRLLHGDLSDIIHNPEFDYVAVSDKNGKNFKAFFLAVATMFEITYIEYPADLVALEKLGRPQKRGSTV